MALALGDVINASSKIIDTAVDERTRKKDAEKAIVVALRQDYDKKPEVMSWIGQTFK